MIVLRHRAVPLTLLGTGELTMVGTQRAVPFRYAATSCCGRARWIAREAGPDGAAATPPPRPRARRPPRSPLQLSDREGVRSLDQAVHLLPRQAPSDRNGRRRGDRVSDGTGRP